MGQTCDRKLRCGLLPPLSVSEIVVGPHRIQCVEFAHEEVLGLTPLVSVVMLTYNHENFIAQAIEGVLSQITNFPIELIVADDCSTDRTRDVVSRYQSEHPHLIRLITSTSNVGVRRNGLRAEHACRGKYVAVCEGDDYWHDADKLQMQADFLEANSDYGLVYTNADSFRVSTKERVCSAMPQRPELCDHEDPYLQILTGARIIWPLTVVLRRVLVAQITVECPEVSDESYAMGDTQRYLEAARRAKVKYIDRSTATRQLLRESITQSDDIRKKARFAQSQKKLLLHYLAKYPVPIDIEEYTRRWIAKRGLFLAFQCRDQYAANEEVCTLKSLNGGLSWRDSVYYFGSHNTVSYMAAQFLLFSVQTAAKLRRGSIGLFGKRGSYERKREADARPE